MKTIAVLAQKGGVGKTLLSVHLAVLAEALLIDMDPQHSAADWWRARAADTPTLVETDADQLAAVIEAGKADQFRIVIIDSPPHAEREIVTAARLADYVLIPTRPAILDLRAIGSTIAVVKAVGTPACIVLNSCAPPRGGREASLTSEARASLAGYEIPVCPVAITQRVDLSYALIDGLAIQEHSPRSKAAREVEKLWHWLSGEINKPIAKRRK